MGVSFHHAGDMIAWKEGQRRSGVKMCQIRCAKACIATCSNFELLKGGHVHTGT